MTERVRRLNVAFSLLEQLMHLPEGSHIEGVRDDGHGIGVAEFRVSSPDFSSVDPGGIIPRVDLVITKIPTQYESKWRED